MWPKGSLESKPGRAAPQRIGFRGTSNTEGSSSGGLYSRSTNRPACERDAYLTGLDTEVVEVGWDGDRQRDLLLVREQPANLDKVGDWLRRTDAADAWKRFRPELEAAQEDGVRLRRSGRFRSLLPR